MTLAREILSTGYLETIRSIFDRRILAATN